MANGVPRPPRILRSQAQPESCVDWTALPLCPVTHVTSGPVYCTVCASRQLKPLALILRLCVDHTQYVYRVVDLRHASRHGSCSAASK